MLYSISGFTLVLMFIAFVCMCAYIAHSVYVTKEMQKINKKIKEEFDKVSNRINRETDKQLKSSLTSPIDYEIGTRKRKRRRKE